jgi:intracellular sulfur oxidation DsrE/DsrF family protein
MKPINTFISLVSLLATLSAHTVFANSVDEVMKYKEAPPGVVFEIVSSRPDSLKELLPQLHKDIKILRNRFSGLSIAIVTHGSEQFSLMKKQSDKYSNVHKTVKKMVVNDNIDVHVCGTYAEWHGIAPEEFPDYVDVAPEGPAQIDNYTDLDYVLITIP